MLPNGGFPPIKKCITEEKKSKETNKEKGFFYSTKTNSINIREILKKSSKKVITLSESEDELEIVENI